MAIDVLLGLQWGDEGKGKIVDYLATNYDVIARFQGGANAGHTLYKDGKKMVLHNIPSGVFHDGVLNLIGSGMVLDPVSFAEEIKELEQFGVNIKEKIAISIRTTLTLPTHKLLDAASENLKGNQKIGSTLRGIAPSYTDKIGRNALRVGDLAQPDFEQRYQDLKERHLTLLSKYFNYECTAKELEKMEADWWQAIELLAEIPLADGVYLVNEYLQDGKTILAEGAQGSMLDIHYGTYPYVTSSSTLAAGTCIGLGVPPSAIGEVIGITKAYCTRVGSGPFPSELFGEEGETLRQAGNEYGATTGRPRRCGWIDIPALKYAIMLNGVTQLVITKTDILNSYETIKICSAYRLADGTTTTDFLYDLDAKHLNPVITELPGWNCSLEGINNFNELPQALLQYIQYLEEQLQVPVKYISTGPNRKDLIVR